MSLALVRSRALLGLQARRYPGARIAHSLADVDAPAAQVHLGLRLDSGPPVRLGPLAIAGTEGLVVSYARCCRPLPGDSIIGHLSAGKGRRRG